MARHPIYDDDDEEEKRQGSICKRRRLILADEEEEVVEQSQPVHAVLNDLEVFDCPICLQQLLTPVFQCVNGHITCSSCCSKVKSKCPFCCMPIGMSRCRGLEKLIGSIFISCKYAKNGCELRTPYSNKNGHEQLCSYVTCFCPQPSCSITCSPKSLYLHFVSAHAQSTTLFTYNTTFPVSIEMNQKQMFLQEQDKGVVFVLINHEVQHGRAFYLVCIGLSILKTKFVYQLTAEATDTTLSLNSVPAVYTSLSKDTPIKNYLTIPSEFAGSDGLLSLSLSINKVSELDVEVIQPWDYDPDADKVLKVVLTDPDIFDCSICLTPLFTPIFQPKPKLHLQPPHT